MFAVPEAYLYALTPAPRWKILLASVVTATVLDFVTMAIVITAEVWLSFILAGREIWRTIWDLQSKSGFGFLYGFWCALLLAAGYLLFMIIILFSITAKKSILFRFPASGLLAFLLACAACYVISLLQLLLLPFGAVDRYGLLIMLNLETNVMPFSVLLTLLDSVALFVITSKLLEKKINL